MSRYKLTLESDATDFADDETVSRKVFEIHGDDLALLLKEAIRVQHPCRSEYVVAELIQYFCWEGSEWDDECWPGHREAFNDLIEAACQISDGWREHNQKMDLGAGQTEE